MLLHNSYCAHPLVLDGLNNPGPPPMQQDPRAILQVICKLSHVPKHAVLQVVCKPCRDLEPKVCRCASARLNMRSTFVVEDLHAMHAGHGAVCYSPRHGQEHNAHKAGATPCKKHMLQGARAPPCVGHTRDRCGSQSSRPAIQRADGIACPQCKRLVSCVRTNSSPP
jgi:hypothetical protein